MAVSQLALKGGMIVNRQITRETEIIRTARLQMGYSQQQVAALIGVHVRQYQRLECEERHMKNASMKVGLAVCAVLGIDPFVLVFGGSFEPCLLEEKS